MDNLEPITRNEMFLNGDDLEPITREEMILAGADLEPITRHEWFLKKYRGGGGGGGYDLVNVPNLPADIASFNDGTDLPMASLKVTVTPYQDLHGYDAPWAGGAGKNLSPTKSGSSDANGRLLVPDIGTITEGQTYTVSLKALEVNEKEVRLQIDSNNQAAFNANSFVVGQRVSKTFTANGSGTLRLNTNNGAFGVSTDVVDDIQLEIGSTATTFAPYSNICPIIGWDEAVVTVADDVENPTTSHEYTIDLNGTRYGGVVDATNGTMDDTLDYIASYNGETLPSTWISDRDVYAEGTTPTIGAEVVYTRATPISVQLAPTPVKSLEGENNISANCGQITEVKYFKKA